jgi:hypothetical protein
VRQPCYVPRELWLDFDVLPKAELADMLWAALTEITEGDEQQAVEDFHKLRDVIRREHVVRTVNKEPGVK